VTTHVTIARSLPSSEIDVTRVSRGFFSAWRSASRNVSRSITARSLFARRMTKAGASRPSKYVASVSASFRPISMFNAASCSTGMAVSFRHHSLR
jgi:hypothetical protein